MSRRHNVHRADRENKALTEREVEVLILLALGFDILQIAEKLCITRNTVSNFVWSIKVKTNIKSRALLAFYAYSKGYVSKEDIKAAIKEERRVNNVKRRIS